MFDLIVEIIAVSGLLGVAALMFAENVFPPIPSEVIMPLAGFAAARGEFSLWALVLAGTFGAVAGAWVWYEAGRRLGMDRVRRWSSAHGRWLTVSPADVDRAAAVFRRHGAPAVLLGRLVPTVRTLISVPAGVTEMPIRRFLAWSTVGTAALTFALAYAGFRLEAHYDRVEAWLDPVTTGVLAIAAISHLYRLITYRGEGRKPAVERRHDP